QARSEFCGAKAAQHAFFASFLARARKDVARRGETRPANKKSKKQSNYRTPTLKNQKTQALKTTKKIAATAENMAVAAIFMPKCLLPLRQQLSFY
ncbi:MAG TPA: hypothetical protein PLU86_08505, partial [Comamonas denitrificans]|nr:hypothetical protein [Comamonas denitrificans]